MMDKLFDLRSLGFRQHMLIHYHHLKLDGKNRMDLVSLLMKDGMSDKDLIRLYLILNNVSVRVLNILLFDYKMKNISVERVDRLKVMAMRESTANVVFDMGGGVVTYDTLSYWIHVTKLDRLVEIFLDEV